MHIFFYLLDCVLLTSTQTLNLTVMQSVLPKPVLEDALHILHMLYVQSNLVLAVSTNELMSRIRCVR